MAAADATAPDFSIVVPVFDESGAAPALAREIAAAFAGLSHEIIFVDDASRDDTKARLVALRAELPQLRVLGHRKNAGQSRAVRTGVLAARAPIVVTLDGDGQNDPADAPRLAQALKAAAPEVGLIGGERAKRQDDWSKKYASRIANAARRAMLNDETNDAGCGLKVFRRDAFLLLPFFDHLHRYLPAMMLREGYKVEFQKVNHRPRETGVSKYNNLGRLWASFGDMTGVMWLQRRGRNPGGWDEA
ncbi:MAG: dolichol-phosphate mannosyltransferase [Caulobacterales bacterium 68-7]|nr:glycosyltransferase family 2 protein [Caulobacterales bacterium]OJU13557.1 MAG: dolichol-phosphate mannosyltransferase [Caulobacterales bacterium 68-7]